MLLFQLTLLFWVAGFLWFQLSKSARKFRFVAYGYVVFFFLMFALGALGYYLASYYPILIAGGAVFWETSTRNRRWVLALVLFIVVATDLVFMPMSLPIMRPARFLAYRNAVVSHLPSVIVGRPSPSLGEWYADKTGWPEMVASVAEAYDSLPQQVRSRTAILSQFYGDASAIDVLGAKYGLPKAISGNQNFWLWGPRGYDGEYVLTVGFSRDEIPPIFDSVTQVGEVYSKYSMEYEHRPIFLCKNMHPSLSEYWPKLKNWR